MIHQKQKIAVLGASGYTGAETLRLLLNHPHVEIVVLGGESSAGQEISEVYPHLLAYGLPKLVKISAIDWSAVDAAFCCLPHATTQEVVLNIPKHVRVFDLSADFRLRNVSTYAEWYHGEHKAPALQKEAVYGLSEHYREDIVTARLIACPGCYPTSALLPLIPLLKGNLIAAEDIIIDSKSGITGAGRAAKQDNLFAEIQESMKAYAICNHRHIPEIEQELSLAAGKAVRVQFSPQVVPMNRGILSTIYVRLNAGNTAETLRNALEKHYQQEPFVHILPEGQYPATRQVRGSNRCIIGIAAGRTPDRAVIVSVIDNLVKGAAGQAVQNFNIACGFPETTGLEQSPLFP